MTTTPNPVDVLKYAAAILRRTMEWTTDTIGGSECNVGHDDELNAIMDVSAKICALAASFGDANRYSDGRRVTTCAEIEPGGLYTTHIWEPDPQLEEPRSWRGNLLSGDPDVPSPGVYEVETDPATQNIHVRRFIRIA